MKKALTISIVLNLVSIGALAFFLAQRPRAVAPTAAVASVPEPDVQKEKAAAIVASVESSLKPEQFRWRQLESTDYHIYIANLRRIECPEQTIHDIVAADVDAAIFAPQRKQLNGQNVSSNDLQTALQQLNDEESTLIARLLGIELPSQKATAEIPARTLPSRTRPQQIAMPVAFQDIDPSTLKLSPSQLQAIADLRQSFLEQIGGSNQDPNDPAYRERWKKAAPTIDSQLQAMIGRSAYQTLQFEAQSAALSQPSQAGKP